jgi:C1A family cysteine protease
MVDQGMGRYDRQSILRNNDLPDRVDLRSSLPVMLDQGTRGTCLAFAVTAAHERFKNIQSGMIEDLSEELLYWSCKQIDGDREPGTSFSSASAALIDSGQPHEDVWPYDGFRDDADASYNPPEGALDATPYYNALMTRISPTIQNMQSWLARGYAVALGILLSRGVFEPVQGAIPMPTSKEELMEEHAILVVGYENGVLPGEGFLILRNSWGAEWADGGYGYLPYAYIERYGGEAWIVSESSEGY